MNLQRINEKNLQENFHQDDWTKVFCMIFSDLERFEIIGKKKDFAKKIGLSDASSLTNILRGIRNYPIHGRQKAMMVLEKEFFVNTVKFLDSNVETFTEDPALVKKYNPAGGPRKSGALTYAEISEYRRLQEESKMLKQILAEKDEVISTQKELIATLKAALAAKSQQ